jgi:hypothetical protein
VIDGGKQGAALGDELEDADARRDVVLREGLFVGRIGGPWGR